MWNFRILNGHFTNNFHNFQNLKLVKFLDSRNHFPLSYLGLESENVVYSFRDSVCSTMLVSVCVEIEITMYNDTYGRCRLGIVRSRVSESPSPPKDRRGWINSLFILLAAKRTRRSFNERRCDFAFDNVKTVSPIARLPLGTCSVPVHCTCTYALVYVYTNLWATLCTICNLKTEFAVSKRGNVCNVCTSRMCVFRVT